MLIFTVHAINNAKGTSSFLAPSYSTFNEHKEKFSTKRTLRMHVQDG